MDLPQFKYHLDPVATGSIERSGEVCRCCGLARGYIYKGPVFAVEELDDSLCPWCIADGTAHNGFGAEFTVYDGIGDYGSWDEVPDSVREEIAYRTPGFLGWQQERWWTHCGDGAVYLGPAGHVEIGGFGPDLEKVLREDARMDREQWIAFRGQLSASSSPTAYVFRCRHCRAVGGYVDAH